MGSGVRAGPCGLCTPSPEGEGGGVSQAQLGEPPRPAMPSEVSRWRRRRAAGTGARTRAGRPRVWNSVWSWLKCCVKAAAVGDVIVLAS